MNATSLIAGVLLLIVGLGFVVDIRGYGTSLSAFARDFGRVRPVHRTPLVPEDVQRVWFGMSICVAGVMAVAWGILG